MVPVHGKNQNTRHTNFGHFISSSSFQIGAIGVYK
jgi:hypothetical protein